VIGWLGGWLAGMLAGGLVGWLIDEKIGWFSKVGWQVGDLVGRLDSRCYVWGAWVSR
jgi:hypothetical protein